MTISHSLQKALNKLKTTCPVGHIVTFSETLFPKSIPVSYRAHLLHNIIALFANTGQTPKVTKSRCKPTMTSASF